MARALDVKKDIVANHINAFVAMDLGGITDGLHSDFGFGEEWFPNPKAGLQRLALRTHGVLYDLHGVIDSIEARDDDVVSRVRNWGRLTHSPGGKHQAGAVFEFEWIGFWRFQRGLILSCRAVVDRFDSMKALGIAFGETPAN